MKFEPAEERKLTEAGRGGCFLSGGAIPACCLPASDLLETGSPLQAPSAAKDGQLLQRYKNSKTRLGNDGENGRCLIELEAKRKEVEVRTGGLVCRASRTGQASKDKLYFPPKGASFTKSLSTVSNPSRPSRTKSSESKATEAWIAKWRLEQAQLRLRMIRAAVNARSTKPQPRPTRCFFLGSRTMRALLHTHRMRPRETSHQREGAYHEGFCDASGVVIGARKRGKYYICLEKGGRSAFGYGVVLYRVYDKF